MDVEVTDKKELLRVGWLSGEGRKEEVEGRDLIDGSIPASSLSHPNRDWCVAIGEMWICEEDEDVPRDDEERLVWRGWRVRLDEDVSWVVAREKGLMKPIE